MSPLDMRVWCMGVLYKQPFCVSAVPGSDVTLFAPFGSCPTEVVVGLCQIAGRKIAQVRVLDVSSANQYEFF